MATPDFIGDKTAVTHHEPAPAKPREKKTLLCVGLGLYEDKLLPEFIELPADDVDAAPHLAWGKMKGEPGSVYEIEAIEWVPGGKHVVVTTSARWLRRWHVADDVTRWQLAAQALRDTAAAEKLEAKLTKESRQQLTAAAEQYERTSFAQRPAFLALCVRHIMRGGRRS